MKFCFTVENIKNTFYFSAYECATVEQGCSAARDGRQLKLPLHGRHWAEACQYVLGVECRCPLDGKCVSLLFINFYITQAVFFSLTSGAVTCDPQSPTLSSPHRCRLLPEGCSQCSVNLCSCKPFVPQSATFRAQHPCGTKVSTVPCGTEKDMQKKTLVLLSQLVFYLPIGKGCKIK